MCSRPVSLLFGRKVQCPAQVEQWITVNTFAKACLNVADIDATVAKLRGRGVTIVAEPFRLDAISRKLAFFADPFGNLIELAEVLA